MTTKMPHRRRNPLTGRWVTVSPQRIDRPWQGETDHAAPPPPSYDPNCFLCPGNERASGVINPDYEGVHVFENDFAALTDIEAESGRDDPLFSVETVRGECRVICFSPDHAKTLPELDADARRAVIESWCDESEALGIRWRWVQIFENKGAMMGCSNPHPHGQVWASDHLPSEITDEDREQRNYLAEQGKPMLLDLAECEAESGERVIALNEHWLTIVPFWASWPFEALLLPRFAVMRLPDLDDGQRAALTQIVGELTTSYDNLFRTSFPYSMGWHGAPFGDEDTAHWQLHAHFYPPLLRSANVRKFMVGYELLAEAQRDLTPERAAEMLRATSNVHYRLEAEA